MLRLCDRPVPCLHELPRILSIAKTLNVFGSFIHLENIIRGDEAGFYAIGRFSRSKFIATEFSVQFLLFVLVCFTNFYGWFKKKIASLSTDQITTFLIHSKSLITNRTMLRLFSNDLCSKETCPWYLRQIVLPGRQKRI